MATFWSPTSSNKRSARSHRPRAAFPSPIVSWTSATPRQAARQPQGVAHRVEAPDRCFEGVERSLVPSKSCVDAGDTHLGDRLLSPVSNGQPQVADVVEHAPRLVEPPQVGDDLAYQQEIERGFSRFGERLENLARSPVSLESQHGLLAVMGELPTAVMSTRRQDRLVPSLGNLLCTRAGVLGVTKHVRGFGDHALGSAEVGKNPAEEQFVFRAPRKSAART